MKQTMAPNTFCGSFIGYTFLKLIIQDDLSFENTCWNITLYLEHGDAEWSNYLIANLWLNKSVSMKYFYWEM